MGTARVCVSGGGSVWDGGGGRVGEVGVGVCDTYIAYLSGHCVGGDISPRYWLHLVICGPRVLGVLAVLYVRLSCMQEWAAGPVGGQGGREGAAVRFVGRLYSWNTGHLSGYTRTHTHTHTHTPYMHCVSMCLYSCVL